MENRSGILGIILIVLLAGGMFSLFNGRAHLFDWDEINFAESAREMIVTGDYQTVQINFEPFWEKPPLFIWMQAFSMKAFGVNEFAARFPNTVCGVVTILFLFLAGRHSFGTRFAFLWVVGYIGSVLPFFYFKSGIIDPWFNLFIFSSLYFLYLYSRPETQYKVFSLVVSAILIGLGVLTKGPVALLIFMLTTGTYWVICRFTFPTSVRDIGIFIVVFALTGGGWFLFQIATGHSDTVREFIEYQIRLFQTKDAGHGGFPLYHVVVFLIGVFPLSIFAIRGMTWRYNDNESQKHMRRWMIILFWVVLVLFSVVKTKIVHYSSLFYFPVTFLGAYAIFRTQNNSSVQPKWVLWIIGIVGYTFSFAALALPYLAGHMDLILQFIEIKDPFAVGNLEADVHWGPIDYLPGAFYFMLITLYLILSRWNYIRAYYTLCVGTTIFVLLATLLFVGKVETYSQRAAIEFYKGIQGKNVYVETVGFKSYAHLFYFQKPVPTDAERKIKSYLHLNSNKEVYFVMKNTMWEGIKDYPNVEKLYSKNGFVFCRKKKLN